MSTTIDANLGEFIASKKDRSGRHSAIPTQHGTVYVPPDGAGFAYLVVKVRMPLAAQDCRFGADERVRVEFVERDGEWRYAPDGQEEPADVAKAYAALGATLENSDVGDVCSSDVIAAAESYAEAREREAVAKEREERNRL